MGEKIKAVGSSMLAACLNKVKFNLFSCVAMSRKRINFVPNGIDEEDESKIIEHNKVEGVESDSVRQEGRCLISQGGTCSADQQQTPQLDDTVDNSLHSNGCIKDVEDADRDILRNLDRNGVDAVEEGNSPCSERSLLRRHNSASQAEIMMVANDASGAALINNPENAGHMRLRRRSHSHRKGSKLVRSTSSDATDRLHLLTDHSANITAPAYAKILDDHVDVMYNGHVDRPPLPPVPRPPPPPIVEAANAAPDGPALAHHQGRRRTKTSKRHSYLHPDKGTATGTDAADNRGNMRRVRTVEGDLSSLVYKNPQDDDIGADGGRGGERTMTSSASVDDLELMSLRRRPIESLSDEELNRRFTDFINCRLAQMKRDRCLHPPHLE